MLEDLRDLDIPTREIRDLDFRSPTGELKLRDPDTGRIVTHLEGTNAVHVEARRISVAFHKELSWAIRRAAIARTRRSLDLELKDLAEIWLPGGVDDLPPGIKARVNALD